VTSCARRAVNDTSRRACTAGCPLPNSVTPADRHHYRWSLIRDTRGRGCGRPVAHGRVSRSGQTAMWSGSSSSRTRSFMPCASIISRAVECAPPGRARHIRPHGLRRPLLAAGAVAQGLAAGPAVIGSRPCGGPGPTPPGHGSPPAPSRRARGSPSGARRTHPWRSRCRAHRSARRQNNPRLVRQRGCDGGALLLAAGHLGRRPAGTMGEPQHPRAVSAGPLGAQPVRQAGEPHRHDHVLRSGQVGKQVAVGLLPDEAGRWCAGN